MAEQTLYRASADWLNAAVDALRGAGIEVIAPTETAPGIVALAPVAAGEAIAREYDNVQAPLKQLFFPITEVLLGYENGQGGDVEVRPGPAPGSDEVVVMGCRPCDAAALAVLDEVFHWDYDDVRYSARRDRTTVVSFACTSPAAECFCTSVGGSPHGSAAADVVVFPADDGGALLAVHTAKGGKLIDRLGDAVRPADAEARTPPEPELKPKFDPEKVKHWLDENFENDFWTARSLSCLGCGACTFLCPTCHCFDIVDEAAWNRGERRRNWDCCSFGLFTLHGSGHNPRPDQSQRYRQRVMHKFKYFPERFGRIACVGCGRCLKACGVGQDLVAALSEIESGQEGR